MRYIEQDNAFEMGNILSFFTRKKDKAIMTRYQSLMKEQTQLFARYSIVYEGAEEERKKGNHILAKKLKEGAERIQTKIDSINGTIEDYRTRHHAALTREVKRLTPSKKPKPVRRIFRRRAA